MERIKSVVRRFRLRNVLDVEDIVITEEETLERETFDEMLRGKSVVEVLEIILKNMIYIPRRKYDIDASLRDKMKMSLGPILFGLIMFTTR